MASTGIMNGTLLGVYAGGTLIAHATFEGSISLSMDTRDATTKSSSGQRDLLEATKSGTISVSALYAEDAAVMGEDLATAGYCSTLTVKFSTEVTGDRYWEASAYVTFLEVNAGMEDNVTYSANIRANGTQIHYGTVVIANTKHIKQMVKKVNIGGEERAKSSASLR